MSDFNSQNNRIVWVDIPVKDLDRSIAFYKAVLANDVSKVELPGMSFAVLDHKDGNGGCLVPNENQVSSTGGVLVYLNATGRIRAAAAEVEKNGGKLLEPVTSIGPHGFRAVFLDCEGNRIAIHSQTDQ
ncbi:VOC family protein [Anatilimnocola floriformis]|uniref:VOC family protein n=1 Tax=Anatilimnocola floriformis TaxID=2948575 RepID=UPI0020C3C1C6|nr:VOC family protein [Anatilimnocola floriformis]